MLSSTTPSTVSLAQDHLLQLPNEQENRPGISFPVLLDNTARSAYHLCPTKFFRQTVQSYRLKGASSIHLSAGGAFAAGLEVARRSFWEQNLDPLTAEAKGLQKLIEEYPKEELEPARSGDKSLDGTVRAYNSYFLEYPLGKDKVIPHAFANGQRGIEFSFAQAIPETEHPETGDPILYGGRFDLLGDFDGQIWVVDEKTTSSLGDRWRSQWTLDSQPTGYCWGARSYGYPVAGAIMRGVGMLKTKITHAEVVLFRPEWQIDRWLEHLQDDVADMVRQWKRKYFRLALDKSACGAYSGCPFTTLCESPEPDRWVNTYYHVKVWNPLAKKPLKDD